MILFAVGEPAIVICKNGQALGCTVIGGLAVYATVNGAIMGYLIEVPGYEPPPGCCWFSRPERLRKLGAPGAREELGRWSECPWTPDCLEVTG